MRTIIIVIFACLFWPTVQALPDAEQGAGVTWSKDMPASREGQSQDQAYDWWRHLAENSPETTQQPESGSLVIPGEDEDQKDKKCLNVCKKWGENCIINPRTGSRDCRRVCKEFGEECF